MLGDGDGVDAVFLDVAMPGLTGLELASVLGRFQQPPQVVFVTAHMEHAVEAFELRAVDYLLKPVREDRLREAVRRVTDDGAGGARRRVAPGGARRGDEVRPALGGRATSRRRVTTCGCTPRPRATSSGCRWARSRSGGATRASCASTARCWSRLAHVDEIRVDGGRCSVMVGDTELQVSRRHTPALRERLRRVRQGAG